MDLEEVRMSIKYRTGLEAVGAVIPETIAVLGEYARMEDWDQVKRAVIKENLLMKRSSKRIRRILKAVKRRYLMNPSMLPGVGQLARAIISDIPIASKAQVLYPYHCRSDLLVEQSILRLVSPRVMTGLSQELTSQDVREFLVTERKAHPELRQWSDYLRRRWSRGFLSFLRDYGFMEPAPSNQLIKQTVRTESFAFFLLNLLWRGATPRSILNDNLWRLFMLTDAELESLLSKTQAAGWLHYLRADNIIELSPSCSSFEEWTNGLGRREIQ
jgi:hypothetical protein